MLRTQKTGSWALLRRGGQGRIALVRSQVFQRPRDIEIRKYDWDIDHRPTLDPSPELVGPPAPALGGGIPPIASVYDGGASGKPTVPGPALLLVSRFVVWAAEAGVDDEDVVGLDEGAGEDEGEGDVVRAEEAVRECEPRWPRPRLPRAPRAPGEGDPGPLRWGLLGRLLELELGELGLGLGWG